MISRFKFLCHAVCKNSFKMPGISFVTRAMGFHVSSLPSSKPDQKNNVFIPLSACERLGCRVKDGNFRYSAWLAPSTRLKLIRRSSSRDKSSFVVREPHDIDELRCTQPRTQGRI